MTIATGSRLGPYEIVAPLGAGGMGEVYRARDTRLGREVAVKVLPADLSGDASRRARFEQEAKSASALNHPNIVAIYDIGTQDAALYIAMELVEGRSLRDLLAGEPLSTRKLLEVAAQIAEGLAKAHGAGIVHRDLKPENVMISRDGFVKILDFGLAKLTEETSEPGLSVAATAAAPATEPGTVLGTVGYMSPEQASGQSVDFRSDQFALGAIVYEMATGRRAFQRPTRPETLVAILREEPEPISARNPAAPAPVRWIVERCLAKDPEDRYASTKDLARDLASVRDHLSEASISGAAAAAEPGAPRRRRWLAPAVIAIVLGAALALAARSFFAGRPDWKIDFQRLTFQRGQVFSARFAPDGETVLYAAAWDGRPMEIFSTRTSSGHESRALGLPSADVLSISSSGEMAILLRRNFFLGMQSSGTLARVPLSGGAPREVLEGVQDADWSPDGKELAVVRYAGSRCRLEFPIGRVLYETAAWLSRVRVSPDGRLLAFFEHPAPGDNVGYLRVVDRAGKLRLRGPEGGTGLAWSAGGDEVWSTPPLRATTLSGRVRAPWTLLGVQDAIFDVSRAGAVLLSRNSSRREIVGSGNGGPERNLTALNYSFPIDLSPDGRTILLSEQNLSPYAIYIRALDGSPPVLIGEGQPYQFSPDGRWVLATASLSSDTALLLPTGAGEPRKVPLPGIASQWIKFFPDGRRLLVAGSEAGRPVRLYAVDISGGKPRPITGEGVNLVTQDPFSPDGRWIAAIGPDRRNAIYPAEGGDPRPVPGLDTDDNVIRWSADGHSLFVFNPPAHPDAVDLVDVQTGKRTRWREFHAPDPAGVPWVAPFVVTPNGRSYVYSYRRTLDDLYAVSGLR